jgi:hypothetical protein
MSSIALLPVNEFVPAPTTTKPARKPKPSKTTRKN